MCQAMREFVTGIEEKPRTDDLPEDARKEIEKYWAERKKKKCE